MSVIRYRKGTWVIPMGKPVPPTRSITSCKEGGPCLVHQEEYYSHYYPHMSKSNPSLPLNVVATTIKPAVLNGPLPVFIIYDLPKTI